MMDKQENQLTNLLLPLGVGDRVVAFKGCTSNVYAEGDTGVIIEIEPRSNNESFRVKFDPSPSVVADGNWATDLSRIRRLP